MNCVPMLIVSWYLHAGSLKINGHFPVYFEMVGMYVDLASSRLRSYKCVLWYIETRWFLASFEKESNVSIQATV